MISDAQHFFTENTKRCNPRNDPMNYNLNAGLTMLVDELNSEIRSLHRKIEHLSAQIGQIPIR